MHHPQFAQLSFNDAVPLWLESRRLQLKARTLSDYREYASALARFFGALPLSEIHIGHLVEYQKQRVSTAGASRINHEISLLGQMLRMAGTWGRFEPLYKPMPLPKFSPPRALSPEQEQRLFAVASSRPEWSAAYFAGLVSMHTTARGCELRGLRLADVDLEARLLHVRAESAKNDYSVRRVP